MVKKHLSRLSMPRAWPVKRKGIKWIIRPNSPLELNACIPLNIVLRDMLGYAKTAKEARSILNSGQVLVNKKARKYPKLGIGLMDVIEFPKIKAQFRVLLNKQGKFVMHPIDAKEAALRPYKITGKKMLKGKKVQLNLEGGINMFVKEDKYKVGDSLLLDTEKNAIKEHLALEKGALIYIAAGNKVSMTGTVESIKKFKGLQPDNIIFKANDKPLETKKSYALVIGKEKPVISLA